VRGWVGQGREGGNEGNAEKGDNFRTSVFGKGGIQGVRWDDIGGKFGNRKAEKSDWRRVHLGQTSCTRVAHGKVVGIKPHLRSDPKEEREKKGGT